MKRSRPKDGSGEPPSPGRNREADPEVEAVERDARSTTARTHDCSRGPTGRKPSCYLGHADGVRHRLVVAAEATLATGTAEREAAARLSGSSPKGRPSAPTRTTRPQAFVEDEGARDRTGGVTGPSARWRDAQDRHSRRGRRQPPLCDRPAICVNASRSALLEAGGGRPRASETARLAKVRAVFVFGVAAYNLVAYTSSGSQGRSVC